MDNISPTVQTEQNPNTFGEFQFGSSEAQQVVQSEASLFEQNISRLRDIRNKA